MKGVLSSSVPQSSVRKTTDCYLDVIIYIIIYIYYKLFSQSKRSVNNGLRTEDTEDTIPQCCI